MAVRRAGSRRIVVGGVAYLWRFPWRMTESQEDGWPGVSVTVNRENGSGRTLRIAFPGRFHLSGPVGQDPPRPVLPSDVARGIREAITAGWREGDTGPPFLHRVVEDG